MAFIVPAVTGRSVGTGLYTRSVSRICQRRIVVMGLRSGARVYDRRFDRSSGANTERFGGREEESADERVEHGVKEKVDKSVEQDVEEKVEESAEQGVEEKVEESAEQGVEEKVEESVEHGAKEKVEESVEHGAKEKVDEGADQGAKEKLDARIEQMEAEISKEMGAGNGVSGNGTSDYGGGDGEGDGEESEEKEDKVGALLRESQRRLESLPEEVRAGTAEQIGRYLQVEKGFMGSVVRAWPGLRDRLVANKRLSVQMGVELCVGFVTKTLAEVQGRGERFWREFDFYLSDMALELVGDAMLVCLLSPMAVWGGVVRNGGLVGALRRLPKHAGQIGRFGLTERVGGFCYKGMQFGVVGFLSSMLGHSVTREMVRRRKERWGESDEGGVELAKVLPTSIAWGAFLMSSSNSRYQLVNMLEQRVVDPVFGRSGVALTAVTLGLRFGNSFVGGVHWLPFARWFGIQ